MVIIAGYKEELEETFFRANRGLESRFIWRFMMDKYTPAEMMKIFKKKVAENEWSFEDEDKITEKWFIEKKNDFTSFGRDMELLLSYTKISHGRRIYGKDIEVRKKISLEDMNKGFEMMLANKTKSLHYSQKFEELYSVHLFESNHSPHQNYRLYQPYQNDLLSMLPH